MTIRLTYIDRHWERHDLLVKGGKEKVEREVRKWKRRVGPKRAGYRQVLLLEG